MNTPMLPNFKRGQRLLARDLQSVKAAARVGANFQPQAGLHTIIDQDGVHSRVRSAPAVTSWPGFWAVVILAEPTNGIAWVKKAKGEMGHLQPISDTEPSFVVWVGYETFLRDAEAGMYDEVYCIPCPDNVNYPYFGFANMPGFAYKEPAYSYSAIQDSPEIE